MAAKIFRHDDRPATDLGLNLQGPPILGFPRTVVPRNQPRTRPAQAATTTGLRAPASAGETGAALPIVVLELPELSAERAPAGRKMLASANLISWIIIALGALLAMALIWTAPRSSSRVVDEAPAWDHPSDIRVRQATAPTEQVRSEAPPPSLPARGAAPAAPAFEKQASPTPHTQGQPAASGESQTPLASEPPREQSLPRVQSPTGPRASEAAEAEMARAAPQGTWDGRAADTKPGEAAPVGRIINVAVPQ